VHVPHDLRITREADEGVAIGSFPRTDEQSFCFEPEHNAIIIRAMRIAVVGAGGVGGYFGAKLAHAGEDVTFIARGATLAALRKNGIRVDSILGDFVVERVNATDDPATAGVFDAVLVAVKAWQVGDIAPSLEPLVGTETAVVPLENGIEAADDLIRGLGPANVLGGLCAIVSFVVAPGHIRHAASEPIVAFGELDNRRSARAQRLLDAMCNAGINADIPPDINRSLWTKFAFITPMSAIGAVTRVPIGVWRDVPETRELAAKAVREVIALATAKGVTLAPDALDLTMKRYDGLAPESTASMQRDVMDGRPSELEAQVGAVVRMGADLGVAVPIHDVFYAALLPQERKARGEM
jgi:2-dehydropantoate 2-reductase